MIQVRNVPDALHRSLKARAAMAGMSFSDYLLGELREIAERPTLAEFRERLHKRKPTYDAACVALAEELEAPLITRDQSIAAARAHAATVEVF
jgi:plasmid stability protein